MIDLIEKDKSRKKGDNMKKLLILGAGGFAKVCEDIARQSGEYDRIGFLDDNAQGPYILGRCEEFRMFSGENVEMYPAIGNNDARMYWLQQLEEAGIRVPCLVHSSSYVSPTVRLKPGTAVLPRAVVNTGCQVEKGCLINCGAIVDHDCVLEEGCQLCVGAIVKAENRIPARSKIEAGKVIENREFPL